MKLQNRVAMVTGAASGIGRAIAHEFARHGAKVVAADKNPDIRSVCSGIQEQCGMAIPCLLDITDRDAYQACVAKIEEEHGGVDILVNNAGISFYANILHDTPEMWRLTHAVNIDAVYWGTKLVIPSMVKRSWGRIISIASTQALAPQGEIVPYATTKGAIISFTRSAAVDLARYGILVNAIAPGCIHTPMSIVNGVDETTTEFFQEWYVKNRRIPLARPGEPEEVARVAVFLASEDCSYMTGQTLVVDGGLTITS